MQLTIDLNNCKKPSDIAATLRLQANLFDGMTGKDAARAVNTAKDEDADETEEFSAKPAAQTTKGFDDENDEPTTETDDETEDFTKSATGKTKKTTKAKKWTVDDVNDACKVRAKATGGKEGRAEVLAILKKKFKVTSVTDLKTEQYGEAIAAMEA